MNDLQVMVVKITEREATAPAVQKVLTEYGCHIRTRLGLHDQDKDSCSPVGILILQLRADSETSCKLQDALNKIDGVKAHLVDLSN